MTGVLVAAFSLSVQAHGGAGSCALPAVGSLQSQTEEQEGSLSRAILLNVT